jgi:protochlorophyllide reductase
LAAAEQLLNNGHRLTLPCRDPAAAEALSQRWPGVQTPVCDLADLGSVEGFANTLLAQEAPIDTLVLNAGLQYAGAPQPRWSAQGFELTFAVNHLAHQALLQRLLPLLLQGREPRLVVTASDVHDPKAPGGSVGKAAGLGELAGLQKGPGAAMVDGSTFHAEKAYKDSKLCNVLMAREVERRLRERGRTLPVVAWSPGLVIPRGDGGFFRENLRLNPLGQRVFALVARDLLRLTETPERAGSLLATLASETLDQPAGFQYWSNRVKAPGRLHMAPVEPSLEARNNPLGEELWKRSAELAGLTETWGLP